MNTIKCSCGYIPKSHSTPALSLYTSHKRGFYALYCNGCGSALTVKLKRFRIRKKKSPA